MEILYNKNFDKAFAKLTQKQQVRINEAINIFRENPHNQQLRNHALKGELQGYHAISAGGNLRLIFKEDSNYELVEFILVGTHNKVY